MKSKTLLAIVFVAVFIAGALLVLVQQPSLDPLAQYRTSDGKLSIPGGAFTKELQQLLFPPKAPESYMVYQPARSSYPTLSIEGIEHKTSEFQSSYKFPSIADGPRMNFQPILGMIRDVWNFFVGSASAADGVCGVGATDNCYWVGGTGAFSTTTHWASISGGVGDATLPLSTSPVIFDTNSGGGIATNDIVSFASGSVTIGTTTTVAGSSNTWTVSGNWSTVNFSSFNAGTSTVVLAASGTLTAGDFGTAIGDGPKDFYNLTINLGVTTTVSRNPTNILISNVFTVNGTYVADILTGVEPLQITSVAGGTTQFPLVLGGSADLTRAGLLALINLNPAGHVAQYVPSATYMYLAVEGVAGTEMRLLGDISTVSCSTTVPCSLLARTYYDDSIQSPSSFNFYTDNHNLNLGGTFYVGDGFRVGATVWLGSSTTISHGMAPNGEGILHAQSATMTIYPQDSEVTVAIAMSSFGGSSYLYAETATMTVNGDVKFYDGGDVMDMGSSTMTVSGNWITSISGSTLIGGTSTVTMTGNPKTIALRNSSNGFWNLTIGSDSQVSTVNITQNTALYVGNILQLRANSGSEIETDLRTNVASSYSITAVTIRASNSWSFLYGYDSLITTTNWDMHWVFNQYLYTCHTSPLGCSSPARVTFVGTGTLSSAGNYLTHADFWNLTIASGAHTSSVNVGLVVSIGNVTTIAGEYLAPDAESGVMQFQMWNTDTPLVMSVGADMDTSGVVTYFNLGDINPYNVTGGVFQHLLIEGTNGVVNLTSNISIAPACTSNPPAPIGYGIGTDCSFLISSRLPIGTITFNTNNFNMTTPGVIFMGDVFDGGSFNQSVIYNAGSSVVTGAAIGVLASSVFNMQTATVTANAGAAYNPIAFLLEDHATVHGGTASVTVNGKLRLWPATDNIGGIYAESSTWSVTAASGICSSYGCPGDVSIDAAGYFIDFGSSTWTVAGAWSNSSTSASWSAGTGTVTFTGASKNLGAGVKPFHNINISGSYTLTSSALTFFDFHVTGSYTMNAITVLATELRTNSGAISLTTWTTYSAGTDIKWTFNPNTAGATVTMVFGNLTPYTTYDLQRDSVVVGSTTASGSGSATFAVTAGWSSHTMEVISVSGGGGGGGGGTPVDGRPYFTVAYPSASMFDWLTGQDACRTIQITDVGTNGTVSYQYDFGDGTNTQTTSSSVRHTYSAPGIYTVNITTSGTYGGTKTYYLIVDATNACSLRMFSRVVALPLLVLAIVLGFVGAVLAFSKRYRRTGAALLIAAVVFGILFIIFAYYALWQLAVPW